MLDELLEYMQQCSIKVLTAAEAVKTVANNAPSSTEHQLLIVPCYNLLEMLEEECDEHETLSAFVQHQQETLQHLTLEEIWRKIAESNVSYLEPEQRNFNGKSFAEIYQLTAAHTINESFLAEEHKQAESSSFLLNEEWVEERNEYEEDSVIILSLPADLAYEAPLWMPMGGFNECPLPMYQSAIMKQWQEQYGAKPIAVTQDTWILRIDRKPATFEEALLLAKQHTLFCQYVLEEAETIGQYADYLMKQDIWYFWWD